MVNSALVYLIGSLIALGVAIPVASSIKQSFDNVTSVFDQIQYDENDKQFGVNING
jgi:hypothetical protein